MTASPNVNNKTIANKTPIVETLQGDHDPEQHWTFMPRNHDARMLSYFHGSRTVEQFPRHHDTNVAIRSAGNVAIGMGFWLYHEWDAINPMLPNKPRGMPRPRCPRGTSRTASPLRHGRPT
jgi:hypothetical protein